MIAALPLVSSALSMLTSAGSTPATTSATAASGAGQDFSAMMSKLSQTTVDSMKTAEQMSVDGIKGGTNVQSVVQAVMAAQENLQTALAVRDKAVAAFTEVSHMSI